MELNKIKEQIETEIDNAFENFKNDPYLVIAYLKGSLIAERFECAKKQSKIDRIQSDLADMVVRYEEVKK